MIIAKVAKINDKYRLVINKGLIDGVEKDMKFFVYEEGEDIKDPDTGEVLQKEEIVKAWLKVIHVQDKISILDSDETENVVINSPHMATVLRALQSYQLQQTREVMKPLNVEKNDFNETDKVDEANMINVKGKQIKVGDLVKHMDLE